ncbi:MULTISPECIES: helix-turn-helix domain-containing protein [unclassified Nonomuraea]|uniref:helix-turn-helix domain-containing protein n=1 Tax=unclassified Nonomuraea TaxID=2593643 RepID=UPI003439991A
MGGDESAGTALARRLRELREGHWPDVRITQAQLREALGVSVPLISSWESTHAIKVPPLHRLEKYAAFFATRRSLGNGRARVLPLADMTPVELEEQRRLLTELTRLRQTVLRALASGENAEPAPGQDVYRLNPWRFPDGETITIICSQLPEEQRAKIPYASPETADYIEHYKYSDLDSLFELHGHLRAANPRSLVTLRAPEDLRSDDFTTHLALLGGVDYNQVTRSMLARIELPVRQVADWDGELGPYFEVDEGDDTPRRHYPVRSGSGANVRLLEDVAFFYRGVNPYNVERTLTICNGMYGRGVYGAVRALTDERFRDRNTAYLRQHFGTAPSYSMLTRVRIEGRAVVTPDWTLDTVRLHEWSEPADGD